MENNQEEVDFKQKFEELQKQLEQKDSTIAEKEKLYKEKESLLLEKEEELKLAQMTAEEREKFKNEAFEESKSRRIENKELKKQLEQLQNEINLKIEQDKTFKESLLKDLPEEDVDIYSELSLPKLFKVVSKRRSKPNSPDIPNPDDESGKTNRPNITLIKTRR